MDWITGKTAAFAYGREHGYLVIAGEHEVRLARFSVSAAAGCLMSVVAREAAESTIVFPLGRGPGRPGGEPELAALAETAKTYAEAYEGGQSLPGHPAWQRSQPVPAKGTEPQGRATVSPLYFPQARRHYHQPFEVERECRELHELPAEDPLADLRMEDGLVPDYNRAEADRRLAHVSATARFLATGDANDCPDC
jgi:hypothetical protein